MVGQHMGMANQAAGSKGKEGSGSGKQGGEDVKAALDAPVLFSTPTSTTRIFHLNRPKALNSLNEEMVRLLTQKIRGWKESEMCRVIVGRGDGGSIGGGGDGAVRAFCAGGDVKFVALAAQSNQLSSALDFFKAENELDYLLARIGNGGSAGLGKIYVVFMEGVTMGGGAGLSYPSPLRISTSTTTFAMPETAIGFAPDVGAQFYLAQLDGWVGAWLGVTGESIYGRSVYELGIATHYVPQRAMNDVLAAIQQLDEPTLPQLASLISTFSAPPPAPQTSSTPTYSSKSNPDAPSAIQGSVRKLLDHAFSQDSVSKIVKILEAARDDSGKEQGKWDERARVWAGEQLETMGKRSPTGMKVALMAFRKARKMKSLKGQLNDDLLMCTAFLNGGTNDMVTGIISKLINKEKTQTWEPPSLDDPAIADEKILETWTDTTKSKVLGPAPKMTEYAGESSKRENLWGQFRNWGLPTEEMIQSYVDGSAKSSGAFALTEDQVKEKLVRDLAEKFEVDVAEGSSWQAGVREKVEEVVARCCELEKGHDEKYLKWVGQ